MLTVITGPMFSGKTTELIRRVRCAEIARQRTLVLKPKADTRSGLEILSHAGVRLAARVCDVSRPGDLPRDVDVLGVDEAQFLGERWVEALSELADTGREVICACLNQDYLGRPFGIAPQLLALADDVIHLRAVCMHCGRKEAASRSFRHAGGDAKIEIGGAEKYSALCRVCFAKARAEQECATAVA